MPCQTTSGLPMLGCCEGVTPGVDYVTGRIVRATAGWQVEPDHQTRLNILSEVRQKVLSEDYFEPSTQHINRISVSVWDGVVSQTNPIDIAWTNTFIEGICRIGQDQQGMSGFVYVNFLGNGYRVRKTRILCPSVRGVCVTRWEGSAGLGPNEDCRYFFQRGAGVVNRSFTSADFEILPPPIPGINDLSDVSNSAVEDQALVSTGITIPPPCNPAP